MKKIVIAALLSAVTATSAFAADEGFYAGVTLGRTSTSNPYPGTAMTKSKDTVAGILGGYQFTKNWGAEAFYTGGGKFSAVDRVNSTASGKTDVWGIVGTGTLPLSDAFSLYGKLGYASAKTSASGAGLAVTGATRAAATYGLGATYNVNPSVGIRFGWDRYAAATQSGLVLGAKDNFNTNVYSLGAVVKF
ncbi:MAG: porin family protein [Gallionella sp.]|jgi:OOP family OmpA-OmpF porin